MKRLDRWLGGCAVALAALYVVGALGAWHWNPGEWAAGWRGFLALGWLSASAAWARIVAET